MPAISLEHQAAIREIVTAERARFDHLERRLYSRDTGVLPPLLRPIAGGEADGVAQPETESQVVELVRLARRQRIPLVPRGRATSGYGGVVPAHGGLVLDMTRMKGIVAVDPAVLVAAVRAGSVWKDVEIALAAHGLALRLYPTSAPSSTVAGWLAQGGAGIGSHAYGWFSENVVSARVVGGDGEIRVVEGADLDTISDAEGTTGIITEVTIRIRPLTELQHVAVGFPDAPSLGRALMRIIRNDLPIWSISFVNPTMVRFRNAGPPRTHHGHPLARGPRLPEDVYITLFSFDGAAEGAVVDSLAPIVEATKGRRLAIDIAHHEWDERFKPMRLKRLGPSLIPAEVVVPTRNLARTLDDLASAIAAPIAIEGFSVRGGQTVLLGFIPHDERTASFNLGYGFALTALTVAERNAGRAYSTGRYFSARAESVLGPGRVERLKKYRAQVDPDRILNPGKVLADGLLGRAVDLATALEPVVRVAASVAGRPAAPAERKRSAGGFPADVAYYAYACAQCGYCVDSCTLYQGRGWESSGPRGKWSFLKDVLEGRDKFDQEMVNSFLLCTTCERCDVSCQLDLPIEPTWGLMRGNLIHDRGFATFPPFEIMAAALKGQRNIWGGLARDRDRWVAADVRPTIKEAAATGYFAGCTAAFVEQDIAQSTARLLAAAGVEYTILGKDEMCCGIPMLVAGKWDLWERALRHNVEAMRSRGVQNVITSCPACWLVWSTYYPEWAGKLGIDFPFEVKHYSEVLAEKIASGDLALTQVPKSLDGRDPGRGPARVTFHDSCHIGRAGGVYEPPRALIRAVPGVEYVEMANHHENALCCGSVLTRIGEPTPTSDRLGALRVRQAEESKADALVALCPCCQFQLRVSAHNAGSDLPVIDLARLAAEALGVTDLPDPNPEVLSQWAMFESFIKLMSVDGMVQAMARLTPQLLAAMPLGMGRMMQGLGRAPAWLREPAFRAMTPVMPVLFPVLLPGMMPRVIPDLIRLVEETIPMPDYLREQLPDLFPEVVQNVMPKMLPELTRKFVPVLFDQLRNKAS